MSEDMCERCFRGNESGRQGQLQPRRWGLPVSRPCAQSGASWSSPPGPHSRGEGGPKAPLPSQLGTCGSERLGVGNTQGPSAARTGPRLSEVTAPAPVVPGQDVRSTRASAVLEARTAALAARFHRALPGFLLFRDLGAGVGWASLPRDAF